MWIIFKLYVIYAPLNFFKIGIKTNWMEQNYITNLFVDVKTFKPGGFFWVEEHLSLSKKELPVKGINDKPDLSDFPWILIWLFTLHVAI